jgi:hypothetical protein
VSFPNEGFSYLSIRRFKALPYCIGAGEKLPPQTQATLTVNVAGIAVLDGIDIQGYFHG